MASKGNASTKILTETVWFASQRKTSATTSSFLATSSTASPSRIMSEASCVRHLLEFSILKVKRALITGLAVAAHVAHGHKAYRLPGMAAIRIRWRPAALGRSEPLLPLSFEESCRSPFKLDLPLQNVNVIDLHLILTICGAGHLRHQR